MKLNIHFLTHLVFFFFIHLPTFLCANDCSLSFDCGDIVGITYPFWGNSRPDYCGHPSFELTCQDNITQINIMSETYQVLSIYQTAKTMRIVRMDFLFGNCPSRFGADNLDFTHFNYTVNDENLNMFYNCSSLINGFRYSCEENNRGAVYAFLDPMPQNLPCDTSVVSVLRSAVDERFSTLGQVLKKGFDVHYVVNDPPPPPAIPPPTPMNNGSGDVSSPPTQEAPPTPIPSTPMNNQTGNVLTPPAQEAPAIPPTVMNNQTGDVQKKVSKVPSKNATVVIATTAVVLVFVVIATIVVILCCLRRDCSLVKLKFGKKKTKNAQNMEKGLEGLAPKSYKYSKIKKMTNFREPLGEGGYGVVYKGKMKNDMVAVKVLKGKKGDFKNEFDTICSTSHDNIVRLRGYCNEKSHSVLIYEYMPKGSLEKYIFEKKPSEECSPFGWMKLHDIAVGIARGLEYLHDGCNQILHLDIKPQNILLDEEFRPKISDFGLSKLCYEKKNTVSIDSPKGTEGYIAPELKDGSGKASPKSDVYSYGMMLLEMVAGKTNLDLEPDANEAYISTWIKKRLDQPANQGLPQALTEEDEKIVRKMSEIGFRCIKTDRSHRPKMIEVVKMLQENHEA